VSKIMSIEFIKIYIPKQTLTFPTEEENKFWELHDKLVRFKIDLRIRSPEWFRKHKLYPKWEMTIYEQQMEFIGTKNELLKSLKPLYDEGVRYTYTTG